MKKIETCNINGVEYKKIATNSLEVSQKQLNILAKYNLAVVTNLQTGMKVEFDLPAEYAKIKNKTSTLNLKMRNWVEKSFNERYAKV